MRAPAGRASYFLHCFAPHRSNGVIVRTHHFQTCSTSAGLLAFPTTCALHATKSRQPGRGVFSGSRRYADLTLVGFHRVGGLGAVLYRVVLLRVSGFGCANASRMSFTSSGAND